MFMIPQDGSMPELSDAQLDERERDWEVRLSVGRQREVVMPLC